MLQRNILAEWICKRQPRQPDCAPPKRLRMVERFLATERLVKLVAFNPARHATCFVTINDEAADEAVAHSSDDEVASLQASLGVYFNTGVEARDAIIWKKIDEEYPMYIFKGGEDDIGNGWYCATEMFETRDIAMSLVPQPTIAWFSRSSDSENDFPTRGLSVPFDSRRTRRGLAVKLGHSALSEAESELAVVRQTEQERQTELEAYIADTMQQLEAAKGVSSSSTASPGESAEPKANGKGGHGGWMPRCASLIKHYIDKDWTHMDKTIEKYINMSSTLRALVETESAT
jgi:hypothetical protein